MERRQTTGGIDVGLFSAARELCEPIATLRQLVLSDEFVDDIERQAVKSQMLALSERALRQVEDVVKMARLTDAMFEMEPVAVRGVCAEVTSEITTLDTRLVTRCRNRQRLAVANRDLLKSIIWHLCQNGIRNSEKGARVELSVLDTRDKVRIQVRDFGPALPLPTARLVRSGCLDRLTDSELRLGGLSLVIADRFASFMSGQLGMIQHRDGLSLYVDLPVSGQLSLC